MLEGKSHGPLPCVRPLVISVGYGAGPEMYQGQYAVLRECLLEVSAVSFWVFSHLIFPSFRINAKLGGINVVPRRDSIGIIRDVADPTIIIGADVMHPGPGTTDRPSYAAVVGSVDSEISKYIAVSRAQGSRVEMIAELSDMVAVSSVPFPFIS